MKKIFNSKMFLPFLILLVFTSCELTPGGGSRENGGSTAGTTTSGDGTTSGDSGAAYRKTKISSYNASGTLTGYSTYSYVTGTDQVSRIDYYSASGVTTGYNIYTYSGNVTTVKNYNATGVETGHSVMTYSGENIIKYEYYSRSGGVDTLTSTSTFAYTGNPITTIVQTTTQGSYSYTYTTTNTYNSAGQLTEERNVTSSTYSGTTTSYITYTYDADGNIDEAKYLDGNRALQSSSKYTWEAY